MPFFCFWGEIVISHNASSDEQDTKTKRAQLGCDRNRKSSPEQFSIGRPTSAQSSSTPQPPAVIQEQERPSPISCQDRDADSQDATKPLHAGHAINIMDCAYFQHVVEDAYSSARRIASRAIAAAAYGLVGVYALSVAFPGVVPTVVSEVLPQANDDGLNMMADGSHDVGNVRH